MTRSSIVIPASRAASLLLPDMSLVDGTADVEHVKVHTLGGYYLRWAVRMSIPVDPASVMTIHRTERLYRIRQYTLRPAMALTSLLFFFGVYVYLVVQNSSGSLHLWFGAPVAVVAIADELFESFVSRSALPQHPRREKNGVRVSDIPDAVAEEIVRLNPEIAIVD